MSNPIRVLHILGNSRFGGATFVVFSLVEMAREHGLEAEILTGDPATIEACGQRGIGVFPFRGIVRPIRPVKDLWAACRLARGLRGRYEIVHTHTTKGGAVGRLAARRANVPVIVHCVHGFYFHEFSSALHTRAVAMIERMLARRCDRIVVMNQFDRQAALEHRIARPEQVVTIQNGIPPARLEAGRGVDRRELLAELRLEPGCFLCVNVGRLARQKGLVHLIEAMALIRREMETPAVHLALAGEGELRGQLAAQVDRLGLAGRVHFLGFRPDCLRWTGGADLFVMSSLYEGHSVTLLEAMGLSRPVVATAVKGNIDTLTHDVDGLLVPARDSQALAEAIMTLVRDPDRSRRLGRAAGETFYRRFTERTMKDKTWELYRSLLIAKGLITG